MIVKLFINKSKHLENRVENFQIKNKFKYMHIYHEIIGYLVCTMSCFSNKIF